MANLLTVYAFDIAITRAVVDLPEERRSFLSSVQAFLETHLYLTASQITGIQAWLARIPRFRSPDPSGFWR